MKDLERVVKEKIQPKIDKRTEEILGVSFNKIGEDITAKLTNNILEDISIEYSLDFKDAKRKFKRDYLIKVLLLNLGNISEVAKILKMSRRSLHRMIAEFDIDVKKIKKELIRPYNIKLNIMNLTVGHVLDEYKEIIHPDKLKKMYSDVEKFSEDILENYPIQIIPMGKAEKIFETMFITEALKRNKGNISRTAKDIKLRFETLHRKMKKLGISYDKERYEKQ